MQNRPYFSVTEVYKNKVKSAILILIMVGIIIGISGLIGYMTGDMYYGFGMGAIISVIVIPIQLLTAKASILSMAKGTPLNLNIESHRRVKSIAEGLAISAGLKKVPELYIINSDVPNAFASGISENSAFVCVTSRLLEILDDQELAGVIAHEFSHILHRDILLSQLAVSLVSIIIMLSSVAARIAYFGGRRSDNENKSGGAFILIISLFAVILQPIARLIANLIELSISRKREYAADAYAVRLCGYNEGLARALEKIGGVGEYSKQQIKSLGGEQLRCMYINFPAKKISALFSTHPPIEERVRIIRNMY